MLMLTIILFFSATIVHSVLIATYKPLAKYNNGMLFAVTLPAHVVDHEDIHNIQAHFNKRLTKASVWMFVGLVPFLLLYALTPYQVMYFFVWLIVFIIVTMIPFRLAFRETLALKREKEWFVGTKHVIRSDMRVALLKNQRSASLWLFTIPFAMAIGIMLWAKHEDAELFGVTMVGFVLTILMFVTSFYMRRAKAKVYSLDSEVNLVLNQARRRAMSYLWLFMAIVENIHFLSVYLLIINENATMNGVWIAIVLLFTVIPTGIIYYVYRKIHSQEQEVLSSDGKAVYSDDDEYWGNGMTYHNPYDKSVFVTKRIGVGGTVNTATLAGKLIVWGSVGLTAAVIIGASFMMIRAELTSPVLSITPDHQVHISYPMYSFDFKIADIEQLTLVETIPTGTKTAGEATGKALRGHFRLKDIGKSRLYVFKNDPPYIRIKLSDQYIFYNEKEPVKTEQLFEELRKEVGK